MIDVSKFLRNTGRGGGWLAGLLVLVTHVGADSFGPGMSAPSVGSGGGWAETEKIVALDGDRYDEFGFSISLWGDRMLAGAPYDEDAGNQSGAAYVFERDGETGEWNQVAKLVASDGAEGDRLGISVATSGEFAIVGAPSDDDGGSASGAAYVFWRGAGGPGAWREVAKLTASDAAADDFFGQSVAISGNTVVVGANGDDNTGLPIGSAYVFERDPAEPGSWTQVKKLLPDVGGVPGDFGWAVGLEGDTAAVGMRGDSPLGFLSGSVYVFYRDEGGPGQWGQVRYVIPSDGEAGAAFGNAVALDGDTLAVGASGDDDLGVQAGAVYVFGRHRDGSDNWGEIAKLTASDGVPSHIFGQGLSLHGDTLLAGARYDDEAGLAAGAAYVYERNVGGTDSWGEVQKLQASDAAHFDLFGHAVSLWEDSAMIAATWDDDAGTSSGSIYLFSRPSSVIFSDGFESGDTGSWSSSVP